jgi:hypothetical protein
MNAPQSVRMRSNGGEAGFQLVDESQAAKILCVSPACLRYWRANDGGPPWVRVGVRLVRYDLDVLRTWVEEQVGVRGGQ